MLTRKNDDHLKNFLLNFVKKEMPRIAEVDCDRNITFIPTYDARIPVVAEIFENEEESKMRIKELDGIGNRSIIRNCKNGKYNIIIHEKISTDEMPDLINIDLYKKKFEEYPSDLVAFAREHNIKLVPLTSMRGQALALMAQQEVRGKKYLGRDEAVKFFKNIGMETRDAIQQFNKATGLKRIKKKGIYCLRYPFESDTTDIDKRKGVSIGGDKNFIVNTIKDWWKKNLVDVPNEEWQIGHLDPTIDDASEKNLAYQPPIQGKYRDRFKFDPIFHKMWPTAFELVPKINDYYTEKEQLLIYESLKEKFEK
jgi:hypothetical protein